MWAHAATWCRGHASRSSRIWTIRARARNAFLGEITSTILKALGCVAAVTNGCVRDVPAARDNGFRFFARGVCVSHAYVRLEHVGHPVQRGRGLRVPPG